MEERRKKRIGRKGREEGYVGKKKVEEKKKRKRINFAMLHVHVHVICKDVFTIIYAAGASIACMCQGDSGIGSICIPALHCQH